MEFLESTGVGSLQSPQATLFFFNQSLHFINPQGWDTEQTRKKMMSTKFYCRDWKIPCELGSQDRDDYPHSFSPKKSYAPLTLETRIFSSQSQLTLCYVRKISWTNRNEKTCQKSKYFEYFESWSNIYDYIRGKIAQKSYIIYNAIHYTVSCRFDE